MNTNNIFQDIQQKRINFKNYAEKALENNWIAKEQFDEIQDKIENDKLVIGVIGQMKAGKSTFLNALIFKDEVLPAATTPMTASLSVITYGIEKKIEAEFYSFQEWEDLKQFSMLDARNYDGDLNQKTKIKAAKEIVEKSVAIQNEIPFLLGTKKTDVFENLVQFVGADGKYISITKSVQIDYPLDYLKGVEIVDTPGFNDPVLSREERTKEFLHKADIVVMLLYAGRAFDATDNDIIFNKVRSIGVGKLLVGINKYDINYLNGETNESQVIYVKEQILKACESHIDSSIQSLVKEQDPLLVSASMALLSQLDITKINTNENFSFHYNKLIEEFEISTQAEMYQKSLMPPFEDAIRNIVFNSKEEILIKKPLNLIKQIGENKSEALGKEKSLIDNELILLKKPDTELEDILNDTERAKRKIKRKIENLEIEVDEKTLKNIKKLENETEDALRDSKKKIFDITDDIFFNAKKNYKAKGEIENLEYIVKRIFQKTSDQINIDTKSSLDDFVSDIEEIAKKYCKDFDYKDYIRQLKKHFRNDLVNIKFHDLLEEREGYTNIFNSLDNVFTTLSGKEKQTKKIYKLFGLIDLKRINKQVNESSIELMKEIKTALIKDFVQPLIQKTEELIKDKSNKESRINELESKLESVKTNLNNLETQIEEMKVLETIIGFKK